MSASLTEVILALLVALCVATGEECPPGFFEAGGGCFHVGEQESVGPTMLDWEAARALCVNLVHKGWLVDLATFDSTDQLEGVSEQWSLIADKYDYEYPYMWVGIHKAEDQYVGVDGQAVSLFSNLWREGHPLEENEFAYLNDVTLTSAYSYGRLYVVSSPPAVIRRCMCRAKVVSLDANL
ncbi:uncharacterized protein LOC121859859 [Homarus americanus]|uniref:Uncharacterized protein n=1 Tax=Homarus americanus TaxID=6706 RepID=A0A8J5N666_HOMAM|nr:uncharacterized protein LOC121859859 [Homarus americanus]KAG7173983.1 hypothetical protein Hamer_G025116 [Homarus americanus]